MENELKKRFTFLKAEESDIKEMAKIEKQFFSSYDRAFDELILTKWFYHNPDMFYAVKDDSGELLAFSIMAPVTADLYQRLKTGQVSDMFDFKEEEVLATNESDYYYIADICIGNSDDANKYFLVSSVLLSEMMKIMYQSAKYIMTTPVTEKGAKIAKTVGFVPVAYDREYPICEIVVSDEKWKKLKPLIEYSDRIQRR